MKKPPLKSDASRTPLDQLSREDPAALPLAGDSHVSRRQFLELAGFSVSLIALGCRRPAPEHILPITRQPNGREPGQLQQFASMCSGCPSSCGLLIGARDGRPIKMEGMPEHPLSQGGLCAVAQAMPLGLYDQHRLTGPLQEGESAQWDAVDEAIISRLQKIKEGQGKIRVVTASTSSPTLHATLNTFLETFGNRGESEHVVIDSVSHSAILDAHAETHNARLLPRYRFEQAKVIVSFGADFLGTWISPVEYTAGWSKHRSPTEAHPEMSWHAQFESRLSLTGSKADKRHRIEPAHQKILLAQLADKVGALSGVLPNPPLGLEQNELIEHQAEAIAEIAKRLDEARGASLIVSDSQDVQVQILVNHLNNMLGNYGTTLDVERPSLQRQSNDKEAAQLVEDILSEQVDLLIVGDSDLAHALPAKESLFEAIKKIPLVISFAQRKDELTELAHFVCPDHHGLESWGDAEPIPGLVSLAQPAIAPMGQTRAMIESLACWAGNKKSAYDLVRDHWREAIFPKRSAESADPVATKINFSAGGDPFTQFWERSLCTGFVEIQPDEREVQPFRIEAVQPLGSQDTPAENSDSTPNTYSALLYTKVAMPSSLHAHNAWLHELPDPISKVTWTNYVSLSPAAAAREGVVDGDIVEIIDNKQANNNASLELPVLVQTGQADGVVAIALAYGVYGTDRFAKIGPPWLEARSTVPEGELVGQNVAGLISLQQDSSDQPTFRYTSPNISLKKTGRSRELACTQDHHSLDVPPQVAPPGGEHRHIVQETSLAEYLQDPTSGAEHHHHHAHDPRLWEQDHSREGHFWGMAIDLNACTGCGACVIACQSENNIPVVGYDEVRRKREMHWLRIDRYYHVSGSDVEVAHQPMMCQHCDNAPCETVCPVLATVGSSEGLNEQIYNRCVGTRYCANNCPYKMRRFNWFQYSHEDEIQNLALNPEVTVRSRGVMEKCTMCVQRIEQARIEAGGRGEPIAEGAIQTACQQSCPATAIVFGDRNDPESQISAAIRDARHYRVLEELDVRPGVGYQRIIRNRDEGQTHHG